MRRKKKAEEEEEEGEEEGGRAKKKKETKMSDYKSVFYRVLGSFPHLQRIIIMMDGSFTLPFTVTTNVQTTTTTNLHVCPCVAVFIICVCNLEQPVCVSLRVCVSSV